MQYSCHHVDTICHPTSSYVTTKLHGTSRCGCNNNAMFSGRAIFTFPTIDVCRARSPGIGEALLNSLFFVFKISFLPNYCVKYYEYIVKWCSGVACNWCVSLDIALI